MNKYAFFGLIVLWLVLATFIIAAVNNFGTSGLSVTGEIAQSSAGTGGYLSQLGGLLSVFWSIFTLQVAGLPAILVIIFFDIPVIIVGFMIMDVIKYLIPFT